MGTVIRIGNGGGGGGGGTTPGGGDTEIQFNDSNTFGGSADLTWDSATTQLLVGPPDSALPVAVAANWANPGDDFTVGITINNPSGWALGVDAYATWGLGFEVFNDLNSLIAIEADASVGADGLEAWSLTSGLKVKGAFTASRLIGHYIYAPFYTGGGAATTLHGIYTEAFGGTATNAYSFWSDEQGVFRIRSDNTFDSVYQAIPALYNPQFTKYTPGAANYERWVTQWNGNVNEIGTEKGGSGTLRDVRLIGATIQLSADTIVANGKALKTDSTTAHTALIQAYDVDGTAYKTFGTLTNGNTPDFTISPPAGTTVVLQATTYKSSDGSTGATGSANATNTLTIKDGLVVTIA